MLYHKNEHTKQKTKIILVLLGFAITDFTPATYQGRSLQPIYKNLIFGRVSYLYAFSTYL